MIDSLKSVQSMMLKEADLTDNLDFKRRYLMTSPGYSTKQIFLLKKSLFDIPNSYTNVLKSYLIDHVSIDGFEISESSANSDSIDGLLKAHKDPFFPKEFMGRHKLYQIGSYNTDLLCVTSGTNQFHEGEILYIDEGYDIYNPQDSQIRRIAKDFEQFLIIVGNLDEIHQEMSDESNYEQKWQEFCERLKLLKVNELYWPAWKNVF